MRLKIFLPTFFLCLLSIKTIVVSQGCLPQGITFSTQEQIDNFQADYPGCTAIEGMVTIQGDNITDLEGLNVLTSIGGYLYIADNPLLDDLSGLENLTSIGTVYPLPFSLFIDNNQALTDLTGLDNLTILEASLSIASNGNLVSLSGLEGLHVLNDDLTISFNPNLTDLGGLGNLDSIAGKLSIAANDALTSLAQLSSLAFIGGDLVIGENANLSDCSIQTFCDYLDSPNGIVNIQGNAPGCGSIMEIAPDCGGTFPCLPFGYYYLASQADVDNFQAVFPGCTDIEGPLLISGDDITNLQGLDGLTSVGGNLWIDSNPLLTSLTGLANLASIGGTIEVHHNDMLGSLSGLDNIDPGSIGFIWIDFNDTLSACSVESICGHLAATPTAAWISYNAEGCDGITEIIENCGSAGIDEDVRRPSFTLHPNPASQGFIVLTPDVQYRSLHFACFNIFGQQVHRQKIIGYETVIHIRNWAPGVYLAVAYEDGMPVGRAKFVVQ